MRTVLGATRGTPDGSTTGRPTIVALRHPVRGTITVAVLIAVAIGLVSVVTNQNFRWPTVGEYLFNPQILAGLGNTLLLTVVCMLIGLSLGLLLAVMRLSRVRFLHIVSSAYIWFFRGTPLLVQLIFWYNFGALYPRLIVGVPFGPELFSLPTNDVITPMAAAILGLGLNQAAYTAEVIRGGILSVNRGQREAAKSIGMTPALIYRRIILPQAMPSIIPPVGNEVISMLKATSLVSVIAMLDLLHSAQLIYARTYETIPLLIVVSAWYLLATTVLTLGQSRLERYFAGK